jgi:phosphatidylglycerol:prolipoprotein diacylglycerol transferase
MAVRVRTKQLPGWETTQKLNDLTSYIAMGVVLGGRLGYMLFYSFPQWIHSPLLLFKIWQGGMSFHGGLLGVCVAVWLFSRHTQESFWRVGDKIAPAVPLGLGLGRIGNFINAELWGRVTEMPWGMIFPKAGFLPRHPSQLYAFFLEGVLLFALLWVYSKKPRPVGAISGMFLVGYGSIRIFEELFRQPDPQYGYLAFGWVTMGQILCLPMIALGLFLLWSCEKKTTYKATLCNHI